MTIWSTILWTRSSVRLLNVGWAESSLLFEALRVSLGLSISTVPFWCNACSSPFFVSSSF